MADVEFNVVAAAEGLLRPTENVEAALRQTRYLREFAGATSHDKLTAAKTALGTSTLVDLIVTETLHITAIDSTPANIRMGFEGNGKVTFANTSLYFTINWLKDPGNKNVFQGDVRLGKHATGGQFRGRWWIEAPSTGTPVPDISWEAVDGIRWSMYLYDNGGKLLLPNGKYTSSAYLTPMNGSTVEGPGSEANGIGGKGCVIAPTGDNGYFFKLVAGNRMCTFKDFGLDLGSANNQVGILLEGQVSDGDSTSDHVIRGVRFEKGRAGIRCHGLEATRNAGWEIAPIFVQNCYFVDQQLASIETNTLNNMIVSVGNTYSNSASTSSTFLCLGTGGIHSQFDMFRGINKAFPQTYNIDFASADITTGAITKVTKANVNNAAGDAVLWTGRPVYVTVLTGTTPTGLNVNKRKFIRVSGTDYSFHPTAKDAFANTNREQWSTAGSGTYRIWTTEYIEAGWPHSIFYFDGQMGPVFIGNFQAEGYPRLAYFSTNVPSGGGEADYAQVFGVENGTPQGAIDIRGGAVTIVLRNVKIPPRHIIDRPGVRARVILDNVMVQQYIDGVTYYAPGSLPLAIDRDVMNVLGPQTGVKGTRVIPSSEPRAPFPVPETSYTLSREDHDQVIKFTAATQVSVTVAPDLPEGFKCRLIQKGAGKVVVTGGSGVTVTNYDDHNATAGQDAVIDITSDGVNSYTMSGRTSVTPTNWALTASVSDTKHNGLALASTFMCNGQRHTNNAWNPGGAGGGGWDSGGGTSPNRATVDMGQERAFTHIRSYTLADALNYNVDPGPADTFTLYGQAGYDLEWSNDNSSWTSIASVSSNNLVRKDHNGTWSARYVRISSKANGTPDNPGGYNARVIELEIWSEDPGT